MVGIVIVKFYIILRMLLKVYNAQARNYNRFLYLEQADFFQYIEDE